MIGDGVERSQVRVANRGVLVLWHSRSLLLKAVVVSVPPRLRGACWEGIAGSCSMQRLDQAVPKIGEKGGKVTLLEGQCVELTRCLKLVKWRSWQLVGCNPVF